MNYLTAMASSPVYEFPYSGAQLQATPYYHNDIDAILSSIAPTVSSVVPYQPSTCTLHCVPQINPSIDNNALVFQVSEDVPIETILQQFGVNTSTLQASNSISNYYRSSSQPIDLMIYPSLQRRRRRLVCREVSDSEDDDDLHQRSLQRHRHRHNSGPSQPQQSSPAIHNLLGKVWEKVRNSPDHLAHSSSAPDLNWQSGQNRPPSPPNPNTNNAWQAMRNAPTPPPQRNRDAVNNVWNRAAGASQRNPSSLSNMFSGMRQSSGGVVHSPPPMPNREAVHDFNALRNLPPGLNQPQPPPRNREALSNFFAASQVPFGVNQSPPPPPPPPNREALNNFFAASQVPFGVNQPPPPQNQSAMKNFFAARNFPPLANQPNPAVANAWSRADNAANYGPPRPPINNAWNTMSQAPYRPTSIPLYPPSGRPLGNINRVPAPASFAALLGQAHRQRLPYSGSM